MTVYVFGWLIAYIVDRAVIKDKKGKTFITMSVWTYMTLNITLFFLTFITCKYFMNKLRVNRSVVSDSPLETDTPTEVSYEGPLEINTPTEVSYDSDNINCIEKITWGLYTVSLTMACMVTGGYYIAAGTNFDDFDVFALHIHGINLLIICADFLLSCIPMHFLHFYFPTVFAAVYVIFTGIYYAAGGTTAQGESYIYPLLDYQNDLGKAILLAVVLVIVTSIVHCIFTVVAILRDYVAARYSCCGSSANYGVTVSPSEAS